MLLKSGIVALCVATMLPVICAAQSMGEMGGPSEPPPADFTAPQYVDSRGCVFIRAGVSGQTTWVPRLTKERKLLCGYQPSLGGEPTGIAGMESETAPVEAAPVKETAAEDPAPVAETPSVEVAPSKPAVKSKAPRPTRVAKPKLPHGKVASVRATSPKGEAILIPVMKGASACPGKPKSDRLIRLSTGDRALRCGPSDGFPHGSYVVVTGAGHGMVPHYGLGPDHAARAAAAVRTPKGYRTGWSDDRLNPYRAKGTPEGQAAMERIWAKETPMRLLTPSERAERAKASRQAHATVAASASPAGRTTVSTKSVPQDDAARIFVQVASFGDESNVAIAKSDLRAMGFRVATSAPRAGAKRLQVVYAGPFSSTQEAKTALRAVRGAGYRDAYIRQ